MSLARCSRRVRRRSIAAVVRGTAIAGRVVSNHFPMSRTSSVRWDLFANIATTTVLEEADEP